MRLQTVMFPDERICSEEKLYFHRKGKRIDFDGYFNLFYVEKRKKYTSLDRLMLKLKLKGYKKILLMHGRNVIGSEDLCEMQEKEYEYEFPYDETENGVFWFALERGGVKESFIQGYFDGTAKQTEEVNLVVDICTYKREAYVLKNLQTITEQVLSDEKLEVAAHLTIWLIDNGNTLGGNEEIQKLISESDGRIRVFPNRNVGGAGGFTRGMLEAIEQKTKLHLTHILLMDDDAVFGPDLFVRLYGFLRMLCQGYKNLMVGGTLLREDIPYIQQAGGEWFHNFTVQNEQPLLDLRSYENCTGPLQCGTGREHIQYSGWWCCCYSMDVVRKDNLPIPLFLHHDDIEFGMRNRKEGFVFLNGIGVWHKGFEQTFAGVNQYYDLRNPLITTALFEPDKSEREVLKWVWKRITAAVIEFRYGEMELIYQGLIDFCKGPDWLISQEPEKRNTRLRKRMEEEMPLKPLEEIQKDGPMNLTEEDCRLVREQVEKYRTRFGRKQLEQYYSPRKRKGNLLKKATFNGWLLPPNKGPLTTVFPLDSPFKAFRKERIALVEPFSGKTAMVGRDYRELKRAVMLYIKSAIILRRYYESVASEYRKRRKEITSMDSWREYLGLEEHEKN